MFSLEQQGVKRISQSAAFRFNAGSIIITEQEAQIMDPKKEREYADAIPDDEETERPDPYEPAYRDGTARNECWAGDGEPRNPADYSD